MKGKITKILSLTNYYFPLGNTQERKQTPSLITLLVDVYCCGIIMFMGHKCSGIFGVTLTHQFTIPLFCQHVGNEIFLQTHGITFLSIACPRLWTLFIDIKTYQWPPHKNTKFISLKKILKHIRHGVNLKICRFIVFEKVKDIELSDYLCQHYIVIFY